jgi:hypothetical protein
MELLEVQLAWLRHCVERDVFWSDTNYSREKDSHQVTNAKLFLSQIVNTVKDEHFSTIFNHSICNLYYRRSIQTGDYDWSRILIENGLDISQFDVDIVIKLSHRRRQQQPYDDDDPLSLKFKKELENLYFNVGINFHHVHSHIDRQEDLERLLFPSPVKVHFQYNKPLICSLLNICGGLPDDIEYGQSVFLSSQQLDQSQTHESFELCKILIENELYSCSPLIKTNNRYSFCLAVQASLQLELETRQRMSRYQNLTNLEPFLLWLFEQDKLQVRSYREKRLLHLKAMARLKFILAQTGQTLDMNRMDIADEGELDQGLPSVDEIFIEGEQENDEDVAEIVQDYMEYRPIECSFEFCSRTALLRECVTADYELITRRLLTLSRDCQEDIHKQAEHKRYVELCWSHVRSMSMLRYLVEEEHADVHHIEQQTGETILFRILRQSENVLKMFQMMRYLYKEAGFHMTDYKCITDKEEEGITIIHYCLKYGNRVTDMIEKFFDALLCYGYGYRIELNVSISRRFTSVTCSNINELRLENGTMNPLHYIACHEDLDFDGIFMKHLLEIHGADVNAVDTEGNTALIYAVKGNSLDKLERLLTYEDVNAEYVNREGESALSLATGNLKILLLRYMKTGRRLFSR